MFQKSIALVRNSIFPVFHLKESGNQRSLVASGTGFFISNSGYFLTAEHVMRSAPDATYRPVFCGNLPYHTTGTPMPIAEVYRDPRRDIFLGKIEGSSFVPVQLSHEKQNDGKSVVLSGYPLPVIQLNLQGGFDLSQVRQYWQPTIIIDQFTAFNTPDNTYSAFLTQHPSLNGMSGGPLFDREGITVGISVATYNRKVPQNDGGEIRVDNGIAIQLASLGDVLSMAV